MTLVDNEMNDICKFRPDCAVIDFLLVKID